MNLNWKQVCQTQKQFRIKSLKLRQSLWCIFESISVSWPGKELQLDSRRAGRGEITFKRVTRLQLSPWMASSILKSGLGKAKKAKEHVDEGLERVRAKPWAEPLGKALRISGKIAGAVEGLVPGASIIGGALSLGAPS